MNQKCIIVRTVIAMPQNITIKKGEIALAVVELPNNYIMIEYNGGNYPIPQDAIELKNDL